MHVCAEVTRLEKQLAHKLSNTQVKMLLTYIMSMIETMPSRSARVENSSNDLEFVKNQLFNVIHLVRGLFALKSAITNSTSYNPYEFANNANAPALAPLRTARQ